MFFPVLLPGFLNVFILGNEAIRTRAMEALDTGGWRSDRRCLAGTRRRYIDRIWEWVRDSEGPALCWLNGVAGSGKSSISHELAATLHEKRRPYGCFFFRHDDGAMAVSAVRLLAYGLSFVSGLRELIVQAMEQSNDTRVNLTMEEQFASFITAPLRKFATLCPLMTVILVIDGVDECPADIRPSFLSAIATGVPLLPPTVKVFISSRPRADLRKSLEAFQPLEISVTVGVGQDDGDIERFLQHELEKISKAAGQEKVWPAIQIKRDAKSLASKAGGLFQWARLLSSLLLNRVRPRDVVLRVLDIERPRLRRSTSTYCMRRHLKSRFLRRPTIRNLARYTVKSSAQSWQPSSHLPYREFAPCSMQTAMMPVVPSELFWRISDASSSCIVFAAEPS